MNMSIRYRIIIIALIVASVMINISLADSTGGHGGGSTTKESGGGHDGNKQQGGGLVVVDPCNGIGNITGRNC